MSTEKIPLQPLRRIAEEDEEPGTPSLPEKLKELENSESNGAGDPKRKTAKSTCKRIFTTLMTLLGYVFLNGAISMISPFYPIVVSFCT